MFSLKFPVILVPTFALLLVSCGSGGGGGDLPPNAPDNTAPQAKVTPANNTIDVLINSEILIEFGEAVKNLTANNFGICIVAGGVTDCTQPISFNLQIAAEKDQALLTPQPSAMRPFGLATDEEYEIRININNNIVDQSGNPMDQVNSRFSTTARPTIITQAPASGAGHTAVISAIFSEPMNRVSVENAFSVAIGGNPVLGTPVYDEGTQTVTLTGAGSLAFNTAYTVRIENTAVDVGGNALVENVSGAYQWIFTTGELQASSVTPRELQRGTQFTVSGSLFGTTQDGNELSIGNMAVANILSWSDGLINASVPNGAMTGPVTVNIEGTSSTKTDMVIYWPVVTEGSEQSAHQVASDGAGGLFVIWVDRRNNGTNKRDIYAQHLASDGSIYPGWPVDGKAIAAGTGDQWMATIMADGNGGAFIAWNDHTSADVQDINVIMTRIDSAGNVVTGWPANGLVVVSAPDGQWRPRLSSDGNGGVFVAWIDERFQPDAASINYDIFITRVDANGAFAAGWSTNGVSVVTQPNEQGGFSMIAAGDGGVIIAWHDGRNTSTSLYNIYAQKITASGAIESGWPVNGLLICNAIDQQFAPILVSDGANGAIIAWYDYRGVAADFQDVYAHRVNANGTLNTSWPLNGLAIATGPESQWNQRMISDGSGGAIIVWQDNKNKATSGNDIYATRITASGNSHASWPATGMLITNAANNQWPGSLIGDGAGGAYLAWSDWRNFSTERGNVYVQRFTSEAAIHSNWPSGGILIRSSNLHETNPLLVPQTGGGLFVTWFSDLLGGTVRDIYGSSIGPNGMQ